MSNVHTTLWKLEPHTEAKHAILRKYLDAWMPILGSHNGRIVFIDGFAGPGEYEGGQDGSPVIAIKSVIEHILPIKAEILFIFVENEAKRCKFLEEKLKTIKLPGNVKYECICGEFAKEVEKILDDLAAKDLKLAPTFAFVDPFGFKGIPYNLLKRSMKNDKCEVLINFMLEDITRFLSLPQNEGYLTDFFGTDEWKKALAMNTPKEKSIFLHGLYQVQLSKIAKHVLSFKMVNKFNKIDYFLFFTTNHLLGLYKMKESMWRVDPSGNFEFSDTRYNPFQTVLFEQKPNYASLKKIILNKFKGKKVCVKDLESFILIETPFLPTHYKKPILVPLEKEGKINVVGTRKRECTYPDNVEIEFL